MFRPILRWVLAISLSVAIAVSTAAAPATRPNDKEWLPIAAEGERISQLRKTAPLPAANAARKDQLEALLANEKRIEPAYTPFLERLREYYERTSDPRAARLYAGEKIRIGDHYLYILARYDRAIALYQNALAIDPENGVARERLVTAEARRFVTMESFSAIRAGMKESEVRGTLGMPREDWIKQVTQKSRLFSVWIYPKRDGGASAVYFDNGVVYHTNWNAAPPA